MKKLKLPGACSLLAAVPLVAAVIDESSFSPSSVINKDVVILGGGASGAYAAVRLREDLGKSILVIEKQDRLGGHVATYTDPTTGIPYDYGVQSYIDYAGARDFFARFNVSVTGPSRVPLNSSYVDFETGATVSDYVAPNSTARTAALAKYLELCKLYEDSLLPGYWDFPSPDRIPADLLMEFGDFAQKYGIEAAVPQIFEVTGLGVGNIAATPTIYVMQAFGAPMARVFLGAGSTFVPASRNNSELYDRIGTFLGNDVLYSSTVVKASRSTQGVKLVVRGNDRGLILVKAKCLLVAFEPTLQGMEPLDLDKKESDIFEKWSYSNIYAGIVTHPSLPVNVSLINTRPAAAPSNYLMLPQVPLVARFDYMGTPSNLFRVLMVGDETLNRQRAMELVRDAFEAMVKEGTLPAVRDGDMLEFVAFADHGAMHLRVSPEELQQGFVQTQYALQGHRATWYTGAAWSAQFTTILWAFTETILLRLTEGI